MSADTIKQVCLNCKVETKFYKTKINHPFHLALCVLTGGLWLISYAALLLGHRYQLWVCGVCDHHQPALPAQNQGTLLVKWAKTIRRIFQRQSA